MLETLRDLSVIQNEIAQDFYEMYETKAAMYNTALKHQDICRLVDQHRVQMEEQIKVDMCDPISKYQGQFKEMKQRIELRHTRRLDMDRYGRDVKTAQEKANVAKLPQAEAKYNAAVANYNALHEELMKDLPKLYEDRIPFFDPVLATYTTATAEYYRQCAKTTAEILGLVAHINRAGIHEHPRITTPTDQSAAHHSMTPIQAAVASSSSPNRKTSIGGAPEYDYAAQYGGSSSTPSTSTAAPASQRATYGPGMLPAAASRAAPQLKAKALFDFNAAEANEVSFKVNDTVIIHNTTGDWWEGEVNGKRGLLPSNYVQLLQ